MACVSLIGALALAGCSTSTITHGSPTVAPGSSLERTLSAQDQASLDAQLAGWASRLGLTNPPKVDRIRLVSQAETPQTQIACLTAAGFPATLSDDGEGWAADVPAGQSDAYHLVAYTCQAQYPTDPAQDDSRITDAQKHIAYTYLTQTLVACLAEHGHKITGIPSEETFLGAWDTGAWNPYTQVPDAPNSLMQACPMNTPPDLLWGS